MPLHRHVIIGLFLANILVGNISLAQQSVKLDIRLKDRPQTFLSKLNYSQDISDSLLAIDELNGVLSQLHSEGYLLAKWDNLQYTENILYTDLLVGPEFEWLNLSSGDLNDEFWKRIGFNSKSFKNQKFQIQDLAKLESKVLRYAENHGFPFASIRLDSLQLMNKQISASLKIELGPLITFDSLRVEEPQIIKPSFASSYLGIALGDFYDQRKVDGLVRRINKLNYLKVAAPPEISFQNEEATVSIELEKRPVNTIDGIIGFLPNNSNDNGLLITGEFDLELYNPFSSDKHIGIHWRRLREETQRLALEYDHPHILGSAISLETSFNFLKQDSTFNRRDFGIDFNINLGLNASLGVVSQFINTDLIATSQYDNNTQLPNILDFQYRRYGLKFSFNSLDDNILPSRGLNLELSGTVGNKIIQPNSGISNELYQNVDLKSIQYQYDLQAEQYWSIGKKAVLLTGLNVGWLNNPNLFQNDAYRIGGLKSIRGFNEATFFATSFLYSNIESRFFLDDVSYLLLFTDLGFVNERFVGQENQDTNYLMGFGTGISFATNSGVYNFGYALGTSNSIGPVNFNQSKIHFGFSTRF